MKEPLYQQGEELFECPECESSLVKYRWDKNPTTGEIVHWGECDFSMCHAHHELRDMDERPEHPDSLMVVKNLTREQVLKEISKRDPLIKRASERLEELREEFSEVSAEKKIDFFRKTIKSDKADFLNMTKEDLIAYIMCMDLFLASKTEFDAVICLKMRHGKRG